MIVNLLPCHSPPACDFLAQIYTAAIKADSGHNTQRLIHLLGWWWCQSTLWTNSVAWQRRVKDLRSCNHTMEAFVKSGPRRVSITVHLLTTPSNPKIWLSIVGRSSDDLKIELGEHRLIPAVKSMWGLISLHDLTSRAMGFKSVSDDNILFLAPASPCQTLQSLQHIQVQTSMITTTSLDRRTVHITHPKWKQDSLSVSLLRFAAWRQVVVYTQQTCQLQKEQLKHFCFVYCELGAVALSLQAVAANKGSNKSTIWSLLATIPLIIADTLDK